MDRPGGRFYSRKKQALRRKSTGVRASYNNIIYIIINATSYSVASAKTRVSYGTVLVCVSGIYIYVLYINIENYGGGVGGRRRGCQRLNGRDGESDVGDRRRRYRCRRRGRGSGRQFVYSIPPLSRKKRGWSCWAAAVRRRRRYTYAQEGRDEDSESVALSALPDSPGLAC